MDAIPSNLCFLVEQLEDARQFHAGAAEQSTGGRRDLHLKRSFVYAAMLAEISDWETRKHTHDQPTAAPHCGRPRDEDGYAALLDRIYRIHRAGALPDHDSPMHARGAATEGRAMDGRRRAGSLAVC